MSYGLWVSSSGLECRFGLWLGSGNKTTDTQTSLLLRSLVVNVFRTFAKATNTSVSATFTREDTTLRNRLTSACNPMGPYFKR
jgi:hypothetical protein